jgi:hypothetical protein
MKIIGLLFVLTVLANAPAYAQSAEDKGAQIAKRSSDQDKGYHDYTAVGKMILSNKAGTEASRDFDFKIMETSAGDMSLLVFNWPGDIRDTGLLTHQHSAGSDDQWIFLPAERRTKRIAGTARSGSFVGSEFAYEDMTDQTFEKYTYKWLSEESCCDVIEKKNKNSDTGYSRQKVWYDKSNNTISKNEFYNLGGTLVKTLTVTGYQKYKDKFWRPATMTMINRLTGKKTVLSWRNYHFSAGLGSNDFTMRALERVR